jgi:hypothetical protein
MPKQKNAAVESNEEFKQNLSGEFAIPASEVEGFSSEQISFPPYLNPAVGLKFLAVPISLDDRDPEFPRWVCEARHSLECEKGSKDEKEDVVVRAGEFFTMSVYAALPLERFVGLKCLIQCTGVKDVGRPQPMFVFDLKLSADDKKLLANERRERASQAIERYKEKRRLEALGATETNGSASREMVAEVVKQPVRPGAQI